METAIIVLFIGLNLIIGAIFGIALGEMVSKIWGDP